MRKAVLITGAAKRIGRGLAHYFAAHGYDVALHYHRSHTDAESLAQELRMAGAACELFCADLSDATAYDGLIAAAYRAFPRLSVLVNNASVFDPGGFLDADLALWQHELRINAEAPIFLTQAFARQVKRGAVVNLLDSKITAAKHRYFYYLLSKKLLAEFTIMAAAELGPHIRVNGVCPGHILPDPTWGEGYQAQLEPKLPLGKIATLDEVAAAVYSLAEAPGITGQFIFIDGGEHLL